jgi:hypothetical protein
VIERKLTSVPPARTPEEAARLPDGRLPFTQKGRTLSEEADDHYGRGARDSHLDFDTGERCITDGVPNPYWTGYNNNYQIVQKRDHVVMLGELYSKLEGVSTRPPSHSSEVSEARPPANPAGRLPPSCGRRRSRRR